jgi:hypothetical protein
MGCQVFFRALRVFGCIPAAVTTICLGMTVTEAARAIDIYPGDFMVQPSGTNLALGYFGISTNRKLTLDLPGKPSIPRSKYSSAVGIARYLYYSDLAGIPTVAMIYLPMGNFSEHKINGVNARAKNGASDLTVAYNVFALSGADKPGGTTVGFVTYLTAPTGAHSRHAAFNIGQGTWSATPGIGIVQNLGLGFFIDATADVALYVDHKEAGIRYSTNPSTQIQAYLRYQFSPATYVAFGYNGRFGGKEFTADSYTGSRTASQGLRLFAGHAFTPTLQLSAVVGTDINSPEGGFRNNFTGQLRLAKQF